MSAARDPAQALDPDVRALLLKRQELAALHQASVIRSVQ